MNPKIDYRHRARLHVKAARTALATPGEDAAHYACLKGRMAIEALTYQVLQAYLAETPNSVMAKWTPKQVLAELLEVDPNADKSSQIFIGKEDTPGTPAAKMEFLGEDKRFTIKWGNKAHNALGNFLHESTIAQMEKDPSTNEVAARAKAEETFVVLDGILSTPLMQANFGNFIHLTCSCGFEIKRKEGALQGGKPFTCSNCGNGYLYEWDEGKQTWLFRPDESNWTCEACKEEQFVSTHILATYPVLTCRCGVKAKVEPAYNLVFIKETEAESAPA